MGYSRIYLPTFEVPENKVQRGYTYKLCPWSTAYRDRFKYEGEIVINSEYQNGVWVFGNSVDPSFTKEWDGYECSEHTMASGRMEASQNPPGWICKDPNCYYYTTVTQGERYKEI